MAGRVVPQVLHLPTEQVRDHLVLACANLVRIVRRRGGACSLRDLLVLLLVRHLRRDEAEVLAEEHAAEGGGEAGGVVRLAVQARVNLVCVLDHYGGLGVAVALVILLALAFRTADGLLTFWRSWTIMSLTRSLKWM